MADARHTPSKTVILKIRVSLHSKSLWPVHNAPSYRPDPHRECWRRCWSATEWEESQRIGVLYLDSVIHICCNSREAVRSWCGQCRFLVCLKLTIGRLWWNRAPVNFPTGVTQKLFKLKFAKVAKLHGVKYAKFRGHLRPWQQHCRWVENILSLELEARDLKTVSMDHVLPVTKTHGWHVKTQPKELPPFWKGGVVGGEVQLYLPHSTLREFPVFQLCAQHPQALHLLPGLL